MIVLASNSKKRNLKILDPVPEIRIKPYSGSDPVCSKCPDESCRTRVLKSWSCTRWWEYSPKIVYMSIWMEVKFRPELHLQQGFSSCGPWRNFDGPLSGVTEIECVSQFSPNQWFSTFLYCDPL